MNKKVYTMSQNAFRQLLLVHRICDGKWMLPFTKKCDFAADLLLEARDEWLQMKWIEIDFDGEMCPTFELSRILFFFSNTKSAIKIIKNEQITMWLLKGPTDSLQIIEREGQYTINFLTSIQVMDLVFSVNDVADAQELIVEYCEGGSTKQYRCVLKTDGVSIDEKNKLLKFYYCGSNRNSAIIGERDA